MNVSILIVAHEGIGEALLSIAEKVLGGRCTQIEVFAIPLTYDLSRYEAALHRAVERLDHGDGVVGIDEVAAKDGQVALALQLGCLLVEQAMHLGQNAVMDHLVGKARPGLAQRIKQPIGKRAVALAPIKGIFIG